MASPYPHCCGLRVSPTLTLTTIIVRTISALEAVFTPLLDTLPGWMQTWLLHHADPHLYRAAAFRVLPKLHKPRADGELVAGEKPQPARIYPWEWAGEMRKSWDEFQTISAARETTSRGTKISEQTKQVCLKKGVKVEEPQTTVEQQTTRKIIKP